MKKSRPVRPLKAWAIIVSVILLLCGAYAWRQHQADQRSRISYTAFIDRVNAGEIKSVRTEGDEIIALAASGVKYKLYRPADAELSQLLLAKHIEFSANAPAARSLWIELCFLLVLLVPLFFVFKRLAVFGRSSARLTDGSRSTTLFTDVAGADEAKIDLQETVEFLKDPQKFAKLGGKMPTGVLLVGPPGTGKTLLARAVAGEAGVPFYAMSGSEFVEMYVGVGASRVRDLFARAKKVAPCIIFIDELDAVGRRRDAGGNGASDERDQTLNQLLVEMDGFTVNSGIVIIAATNRPEVLDPALLRPGRFDRQVMVGNPDIRGREEILKVHTRSIPLAAEVDLLVIARGTPGFSGADLANVVNEAAILAARQDKSVLEMVDFDMARDKILMGAEKKSMVLSEKSKLSTAYHEAGHVMVAKLVPGCDPVHKVSIIPRGRALGVTVQIPEEDIHCYTRDMLIGHIKMLMGGRAAEELVFSTTTTGAGNDLARATDMARRMVCEWGMSEAFGPVAFGHRESTPQSDGSTPGNTFSDTTALEIDSQIRSIVTTAYNEVRDLLQTNRTALDLLSTELVAHETLGSREIDAILTTVSAQDRSAEGYAAAA
ncbi:ATP-dependent zinc metalloprotease FtsH [Geobacter sp. SVR]|uniref:ATP-dependent zinc metalloprotease FtsH n=1 Tax=Geobacter sp. SVR TaxID=2495594 RepID=UPI00143EF912|nr:ATP-dependent zinc metalloprotease FtsH [Geobacter sp. SVR]BCS54015.1 ATP-dependent zinc metalloprotease FtsH [Geobacter sp. SVR]GCF86204.1 ATP-dependent zinc metalloprotease FtsH [Geobacter sp. SVR]